MSIKEKVIFKKRSGLINITIIVLGVPFLQKKNTRKGD